MTRRMTRLNVRDGRQHLDTQKRRSKLDRNGREGWTLLRPRLLTHTTFPAGVEVLSSGVWVVMIWSMSSW